MDINKLFKEISSLQKDAQQKQAELEEKEFVGTAAGNAVSVTLKGNYECVDVKVSKEMLSEDYADILSDAILSAINAAVKQIQDELDEISSSMTSGMKFPGM